MTIDATRGKDGADTGNKREKSRWGGGYESIRMMYAESKAAKLREERKQMRKDKCG